jgi:protein O-GlcNAc transferase
MASLTVQHAYELALGHQLAGRVAEAEAVYRLLLGRFPDFPEVHNNLGVALQAQGRLDEAIACFRRALVLDAEVAGARGNLAEALRLEGDKLTAEGRSQDAAALFREALEVRHDDAAAINSLGYAQLGLGQLDEAISLFSRAIELRPDVAVAYRNLGDALKHAGRLDEAIACYRRAPGDALTASYLLSTLHLHPDYDRRRLYDEHVRWDRTYAQEMERQARPHEDSDAMGPPQRLRVGYVAYVLANHPLGRLLLPLMRGHDHAAFEIFCYCDVRGSDHVGDELKSSADVWRTTRGMTDAQVAEQIRADKIDILVDLVLHAGQHRLLAFARKPAPVQVSYLAYCSTTGLTAMDYRLTDPYMDPPGRDDSVYSEQSLRLPHCFWCYSAPPEAPPVAQPPVRESGRVTFGCLNSYSKVSGLIFDTWSDLLARMPDSRLILHALEGSHRDRAGRRLADRGIEPNRLEFVAYQPPADYFAEYNRIDVALDPFPQCGGATTLDALWMGVPVVSLAGETAVSRAGLSILSNIGLPQLVVTTPRQYIEIALGLAADVPRLRELRSTMRQRMQSSPLMDARQFARDVEAAYRMMWHKWCATR